MAVAQDITERQRVAEEIQSSKARYQAIVEDQSELICRFLPDGTLTFVNEAFCRHFPKADRPVALIISRASTGSILLPLMKSFQQRLAQMQDVDKTSP